MYFIMLLLFYYVFYVDDEMNGEPDGDHGEDNKHGSEDGDDNGPESPESPEGGDSKRRRQVDSRSVQFGILIEGLHFESVLLGLGLCICPLKNIDNQTYV